MLGVVWHCGGFSRRSSNISYEGNENDGDEDEQDTFYAISDDLNDVEWERRKVEEEELRR